MTALGYSEEVCPIPKRFLNVGVEIGQLAFIAAVLTTTALARRVPLPLPRWAPLIPPYAIGALAMFWVVERIAAF